MRLLTTFLMDALHLLTQGDRRYWAWMGTLVVLMLAGAYGYSQQALQGLKVTGMSDQVSWGFYISNFTYLVGVAAAAVMLVIPAYLYHREDLKQAVVLGEGIAVAAVLMCITFVTVDLGRPDRIWHMIPMLGYFNFPISLLAWDVLVLTGYLLINLALLAYVLLTRYSGREPPVNRYFWLVLVSIVWAISIHTVTAFLYSANGARHFWSTAVLAPRFLASAFASGPALIALVLQVVRRVTPLPVHDGVLRLLRQIVTVALIIHLFLLGTELFTEFYSDSEHSISWRYLFFGVDGVAGLVPWMWTSVSMSLTAAVMLVVPALARRTTVVNVALGLVVVAIWIEKGMGLVLPGFIPTPLGEFLEYAPTHVELLVTVGVWAMGALVFTVMAKVAVPILLGMLQRPALATSQGSKAPGYHGAVPATDQPAERG